MSIKRKIALIGASGMLASMFQQMVSEDIILSLFDLPDFDITDPESIDGHFAKVQPDIIVNCAAFTQVDACESQAGLACQINGCGVGFLALSARKYGATLVHISTDFVFSGESKIPYTEEDVPSPCSVYGQSKLCGEQELIDSGLVNYYIVRTSWLYGPNGGNFVETMIRLSSERSELNIVSDQIGTPTYTSDLVDAVWRLLAVGSYRHCSAASFGLYHYSNKGSCSWYDFTCEIIHQLRTLQGHVKVLKINPIKSDQYPLPAKRPAYSVLSKQKIMLATEMTIPTWQESLNRYMNLRNVN